VKIFIVSAIILAVIPISILITILLSPFWSRFEKVTGVESFGHSGPANWCFVVIFLIIISILIAIFSNRQWGRKNGTQDF